MDGACSTHGGDEKFVKIGVVKPKERDNSEDLCIDGRIILAWILGK
jgi:hypothetical protein